MAQNLPQLSNIPASKKDLEEVLLEIADLIVSGFKTNIKSFIKPLTKLGADLSTNIESVTNNLSSNLESIIDPIAESLYSILSELGASLHIIANTLSVIGTTIWDFHKSMFVLLNNILNLMSDLIGTPSDDTQDRSVKLIEYHPTNDSSPVDSDTQREDSIREQKTEKSRKDNDKIEKKENDTLDEIKENTKPKVEKKKDDDELGFGVLFLAAAGLGILFGTLAGIISAVVWRISTFLKIMKDLTITLPKTILKMLGFDIKDVSKSFTGKLASAASEFAGKIKDKMKILKGKILSALEYLSNKFTKLKKIIMPIFQNFGNKFKSIGDLFGDLGKDLSLIKSFLPKMPGGGLTKMFSPITKFFNVFKWFFKIFKGIFRTILGPIGIVVDLLTSIPRIIKSFSDGGIIEGLKTTVEEFFRAFIGDIGNLIKSVVSWIAEKLGFTEFSKMLDGFDFNEAFSGILDGIENMIGGVVDWVKEKFDSFMKRWEEDGILSAIVGTYFEILKDELNFLGAIFDSIVKTVTGFVSSIFGGAEGAEETKSEGAEETKSEDGIFSKISNGFKSVMDALKPIGESISTVLDPLINYLNGFIEGVPALKDIKTKVMGMFDAFVDTIKYVIDKITTLVKMMNPLTLAGKAVSAVSNIWGGAKSFFGMGGDERQSIIEKASELKQNTKSSQTNNTLEKSSQTNNTLEKSSQTNNTSEKSSQTNNTSERVSIADRGFNSVTNNDEKTSQTNNTSERKNEKVSALVSETVRLQMERDRIASQTSGKIEYKNMTVGDYLKYIEPNQEEKDRFLQQQKQIKPIQKNRGSGVVSNLEDKFQLDGLTGSQAPSTIINNVTNVNSPSNTNTNIVHSPNDSNILGSHDRTSAR